MGQLLIRTVAVHTQLPFELVATMETGEVAALLWMVARDRLTEVRRREEERRRSQSRDRY